MKILIFGTGGVGGYVGAALARTHADTYIWARGKSLTAIREKGIALDSITLGKFTARPTIVSDQAADFGPVDAIILACKGNALPTACKAISPCLTEKTVVVPLLNGVLVSEMMAPYLPPCQLADGLIRVYAHRETPGVIVHTGAPGSIFMGLKDGKNTAEINELGQILNQAGVPTTVSPAIVTLSWQKYLLICTNSAMCLYYEGAAGKIRQQPGWQDFLNGLIDELLAIAKASGAQLATQPQKESLLTTFAEMGETEVTSLYRDIQAGKAIKDTEFEHLIGHARALGQKYQLATPHLDAVYQKYNP